MADPTTIDVPEAFAEKASTVQVATTLGARLMRSSDADFVRDTEQMNDDWLRALDGQRKRMWKNFKSYVPVDGSSWDDDAYDELLKDDRHPVSFDISSRKIDTLAGSIRSEKWDYDFQALNGDENYLLKRMKYMYYADKELYNYASSEARCLIRGLLHSGYEEMYIDTEKRTMGGIGFRCPQVGSILKDPFWLTDELDDWKRAIRHAYFTPREIIQKWETADPFIRQVAGLEKQSGEAYDPLDNVSVFEGNPYKWGSKYLVIERRWIEERKTTRLYGKDDKGQWVEFPLDVEDREEVQQFASANGVSSWRTIKELPYTHRVLMYGVCVPRLSAFAKLAYGEHDVQCGTIGFFPFSSYREMGIDKGVMDALIDPQRTLNYRQSKIDDIIASMAANLKTVNVDGLKDGMAGFEELKRNATKPNYMIATNADGKQVISTVQANDGSIAVNQQVMQMVIDMFDRVAPVTPALEGTGPSEESGVLFEMRHAVTKLGTLILYDGWRQHLQDKAEAWYNQALITYKDQRRQVQDTDTNTMVDINVPEYIVEGNSVERRYKNYVGDLPRTKVFVSLRKDSPTQRVAERAMLYDITKILAAHPELFASEIRILINEILQTVELEPDEKKRLSKLGKLEEMRDLLRTMSEIEGAKAQGMQAKVVQQQASTMLNQMAQQMMGGMGGQPGAPGPGGPQPAGGPPTSQPKELPPIGGETPEQEYMNVPTESQGIR